MTSSRPLVLLAYAIALTAPAWADDLFVPGQFGTIQDAINAAQPGDTVLVQQIDEAYGENLVMRAGVSVIGVGNQMPTVANPGGGLPTVSFPDPNTGRDTVLCGMRLINGVSVFGAGILLGTGASPTIKDNLIEYQQSQWGAGIFAWPHGDPLIENNTIRLCEAMKGGGGVFLFLPGPQTQVHNNLVGQNMAALFGGGAILWGGSVLLTYNTFELNQSQDDGGGMWVSGTDLFAYGNDFVGNSASAISGRGGGAYLRSLQSPVLYEGSFQENVATEGGGLYLDSCTADVRVIDFKDNVAHESGGGVFAGGWQGAVTLSACDLRRNRAGDEWWLGEGGGVFCDGAIDLEVVNCVLYSNSAGYQWQSGSGIRVRSAELVLVVNNTLVENHVNGLPFPGSGLAIGAAADARVTNNWFAQHETHVVRDNMVVPVTLRTNLYTSNDLGNLVLDPTDGIDLPLFVNPGVDFHILAGDPGINQGSSWLPGVPNWDMDGQWRHWALIDIGADELGK